MKRTERSAPQSNHNKKKMPGRRLALIFAALCVLIVVFGTAFLTNAEEIDAEYVQIGSKTYGIETAMKLVDADLALLQWRAKGSSTAVSAAFNEGTAEEPQYVVLQGFEAVYNKIYDRLLALFETKSDTSVLYSEAAAISNTQINSSTVLWKASGTVTLDYKKTVAGGRLIVLADDTDDPCSINLTAAASQFALSSGSLAIQARDDGQKIGVTCTYTGSDKTAAAFSVSGGSLYLQNCDIHGFNFSSQSFSTILFPTGNVARYLYMSDSSLRDVSGKEAPGIFLKVYGGNNSNAKKTRLYINHSRFEDCVTPPGDSNTVGGSAIRSYAADVSQLEVRNSTFYQNRVGSKTAVQSGTGTGGGAIYWKSIDGKAKLISCVFEENHSSVVGGAILNMGTMEIEGCRFVNNKALKNGGAIAAEPPYTSSTYTTITGSTQDAWSKKQETMSGGLTLDENTTLIGNEAGMIGGGIYFNAVSSQISSTYPLEKFQMRLIINGAEINGNTAGENGGGVGVYLDYDTNTYTTGVTINAGSRIINNEAAQNGGAIWIKSDAGCDCLSNEGVLMAGGETGRLENNRATNGGAIYIEAGKPSVETMNFYIQSGLVSQNHADSTDTDACGGAAYIKGGSVLMSGGSVKSCTAKTYGGAVYVENGSFTMSAGDVLGNESSADMVSNAQRGGAVYVSGGNVEMSGGEIARCKASEEGGAVYMSGGAFAIGGGTVSENVAVLGAGAYLAAGEMLVSGGSMAQNRAENGGGAYLGGGRLTVSGGSIAHNEAENGAGAYLASGTMTVTDGSITANEATSNGAGAYLAGGTFAISGGVISENTAVLGAGAYLAAGEMLVSGGSITQNSAKDGAGAYLLDGAMTVTDGSITVNEATASGGALYMGGGTFTIKGGSISNNTAENGAGAYLGGGQLTVSGGSITKNYAGIGAGVYLSNGTMRVSENGLITENGFLEEDGAVIATTQKGGGAYISGGDLYVSGGTITKNVAENGAGAFVSDGDVFVTGGVVSENKAVENGGAFSISNGNFTMVGGVLTKNRAGNDGGAIYVSSSQANTAILIRSGSVTYNDAGNSGGALSVYGLDGVEFTITIGSQTNHAGRENAHACSVRLADGDEPCPIVEYNTSAVSGGAIYLSGSYDAVMNMHCLVENGNVVGSGASPSNFMKVDGGSLNIATEGSDGEECGNVVIRSSIQVSHGKVLISGDGENPRFEDSVSVEVAGDATFKDLRTPAVAARTIQYFENLDQAGKYVLIDSLATEAHRVRVSMYAAPGKVMVGWMLMRVENGEYVPTGTVYHAYDYITPEQHSGNLIFFAIWEVHGYSVEFLPNANGYTGAMEKQEFAYSVHQNLTLNAYVNPGYRFDHWEDAYRVDENGNKIVFANGQEVWELTDVHEATITLKAIWIVCPHDEMEAYTLTRQTSSLTRTCPCQGYSETVSLPSVTETYREGILRGTAVEQLIPATKTGVYAEKTWNNLEIVYSGITNGGVELNGTTPPTDAGSYTASVTVSEDLAEPIVITATIIIGRADRLDFPNTPQFDDTGKDANGDTVIKITGDYQPGLEYRFVYYDEYANAHGEEDWFAWTEENDPPTRVIDHIYTKYYVDVRYAMTPNFNPSGPTRGGFSISYGNVTFNIVTSGGLLIVDTEDAVDRGQMRVEIISATGYYVPSIVENIDSQGYDGFRHQSSFDPESRRWTYIISEIENPQEDIAVTVTLSGAVLNVSIETSTVKNEAFDNIAERAESNVKISRDSAYTVRFKVAYFAAHYSDPSIAFSTAIPAKTTIIMMDLSDGTYWFYTAETEKERVALADFTRMGVVFDLNGRENFALQFVVDFSDCASAPEIGELVTRFAATGDEKTSALPSSGDAVSYVRLVETPSFRVELVPDEDDDALSSSVSYEFATTEDGVGVSGWDGVAGVLLLTPINVEDLPCDLRLEVKINGKTSLYSLVNGTFAVALPSVGSGEASLALLSDMWQDADRVFRFRIEMCVSATQVASAPKSNVSGEALILEYSIRKSVAPPIISASVIGQLPVYDENGAVSLTFGGTVKGLGDGDKLRAVLYFRDDNGRYSSTTQELGADAFTVDGERFRAVLGLDSFKDDMKNRVGSLNLMLSVEVVEIVEASTGEVKVKASVPLYFILVDPRQ